MKSQLRKNIYSTCADINSKIYSFLTTNIMYNKTSTGIHMKFDDMQSLVQDIQKG